MKSILKQLYKIEDEPEGPSIDSENMEERIQCRRLRIKNRVENKKKLESGELDNEQNKRVDLSKSRKQIELSRNRVNKLTEDGMEFLTNICVASDARENARRIEDEKLSRERKEKLESEAKSALDRFDEITKKWETSLQKEVPQDLNEMLIQQTNSCRVMIEEKNKLIERLQLESKAKDDSYVKELKKQSADIDLMIQRMNEQIECMSKAYREELLEIEKAFNAQRNDLLGTQNKEWNELLEAIKTKQIDYLEARKKRAEENDERLNNLRSTHAEEYNMNKVKTETEIQNLEQFVQSSKAVYQLNMEKLEYNFQILKKKDEENTITKSQQKRRITKLQDTLNNLKQKHLKVDKNCRSDNITLTEDYKRRMDSFRQLQEKSKALLKADSKHFRDIWLMNEAEIQENAKKILQADQIISEQQLGVSYEPPADTDFLNNRGPLNEAPTMKIRLNQPVKTASSKSALEIIKEHLEKDEDEDKKRLEDDIDDSAELSVPLEINTLNKSTLSALLNLLCEEGAFLIEEKLKRLLEPLEKEEASLMKLDAIFSALGIESEEDINRMLPYFVGNLHEEAQEDSKPVDATLASVDEMTREILMKGNVTKDLVHPSLIIRSLHDFVINFYQDEIELQKAIGAQHSQDFQLDGIDSRDDSLDSEYWNKYASELIPKDKEIVWDAMIESLDKYFNTLNSRKKIITDIDAFKTQNAELKFLLQQYMNAPMNRDLQVPPGKVMQ